MTDPARLPHIAIVHPCRDCSRVIRSTSNMLCRARCISATASRRLMLRPRKWHLTDTKRKLVLCRLGDSIRVTGIADLGDRSIAMDPARIALLKQLAHKALLGAVAADTIGAEWAGLRAMTPFSTPIIGVISPTLAVNIGPRHAGVAPCSWGLRIK